ncbi:MAG TPA: hypothetical protein VGJ97_04360 [Anaerolineaceae bacterium]|jgi:hypothetical protein
MAARKRSRNTQWLVGLVAAAAVYTLLMASQPAGSRLIKPGGLAGVILGLYIGAQPVANFLELVLFSRVSGMLDGVPRGTIILWFTANLLALLAGWFVIMIGAIQYTSA